MSDEKKPKPELDHLLIGVRDPKAPPSPPPIKKRRRRKGPQKDDYWRD